MDVLELDNKRYGQGKMPKFQKYLRKTQTCRFPPCKILYKALFAYYRNMNMCEMSISLDIGPGLYIGHPYGITINPGTVIGSNVNLHKGVTLGRENRGSRKGAPVIGNRVWIGVNATVVGCVHIGDDVLIAPNAFINFDVPAHSIVIGNPAKIVYRCGATDGYINNAVDVFLS